MRKVFGQELLSYASKDDNIHLIVGDIGFGIFDEYKQHYRKRFLNIGICEQSMISFASGMALEGYKPVVYSITPFLIERAFEQIKLDINHQNTNVILVGYDDYPKLGPTHKCLNIEKIMELFENIKSYFPKDVKSLRNNLADAFTTSGPSFIKLKNL